MTHHPILRLIYVALAVVGLDQATKQLVLRLLGYTDEVVIVEGFFKFVHWGNTGAAWSLFHGNNQALAVVSAVALVLLFLARRHFSGDTRLGQVALGLMFGGIIGNLIDRLTIGHVVDFLYFHVQTRAGREAGFPAFNVADTAICVGVGLVFLLSWSRPAEPAPTLTAEASPPDRP
jgi:signal peptidase II